jgi:thiol:disulfide interchange protein DsbD
MRIMKPFVATLLLILSALAAPAAAEPVKTAHLEVELVGMTKAATPGSTFYVALRHRIAPEWHTYWRNAGDSGQETQVAWTLPEGWRADPIVWPRPERLRVAHLMNYGFSGEVLLPIPIHVPANAPVGGTANLKAAATFLVCKDVCVPEEATVSLAVPVRAEEGGLAGVRGQAVADALAAAPKPAGLKGAAAVEDGKLRLSFTGGPLQGRDFAGAYFFPYDGTVLDHAAVQAVEHGAQGVTLIATPGIGMTDGVTAPIAGVLALRDGAWEVTAEPGAPLQGAAGLGPLPNADEAGPRQGDGSGPARADLGVPLAVLFAFLGGLILNLMPCVFPVLSMKAAALGRAAHDPREARRDGLGFLAGVLATFLVLAGALIAARAAGEAVGWGFQLQSPWLTAILALLMLAVALNLSGVFEVGSSVQGVGSGLSARSGVAGAFFTGALAVVVAAPCTAPFMAGAIGFALTQNAAVALLIFLALGLGLAAPFVALSFSPALLRRLPKPGPWMERLRRYLAFPMYAAAAWMAWVFARQAGDLPLGALLGAAVLLALALQLVGQAQRLQGDGRRPVLALGSAALAMTFAAALTVWSATAPQDAVAAPGQSAKATVPSEPYSPARLAELRAQGKPVFVNFTADWCVTCKVNEGVALSSRAVADAFERTDVTYLKGDWTRRDATIANALAEHGRSGVPLYLVYGTDGGAPKVLPQLLTEGAVIDAVEEASRASE